LTNLQLDGNCFGTEGRENLRQILIKLGRIDALNSLDEDYTEDEEEEEDNENEQSEKEESDNNEDEASDNKDNKEQGNIAQSTVVTVAEFVKSPIGEKLLLLQGDNVQAFIDYATVRINVYLH